MALRFRTGFDAFDRVFPLLALVLAGTHLYLGPVASFVADDRATQFVLVALTFLVGLFVYVTSYWRPVLYLFLRESADPA